MVYLMNSQGEGGRFELMGVVSISNLQSNLVRKSISSAHLSQF